MPIFPQMLNRWAGDASQWPQVLASEMVAPPFWLIKTWQGVR